MNALNSFVIQGADPSLTKFAFLMDALTEEVIAELEEKDDELIGAFMAQMGDVIAWIGHGDNERLPDSLRMFAEEIEPTCYKSAIGVMVHGPGCTCEESEQSSLSTLPA